MALQTRRITIEAEGRDKGKTFVLQELPADQADIWATLAVSLIEAAGISISADARGTGVAGLASIGIPSEARVMRALQDPQLSSMWDHIRYEHSPDIPLQKILPGVNSQIEDWRTRNQLRFEFLKLHTDFFSPSNASPSLPKTTSRTDLPQPLSATRT